MRPPTQTKTNNLQPSVTEGMVSSATLSSETSTTVPSALITMSNPLTQLPNFQQNSMFNMANPTLINTVSKYERNSKYLYKLIVLLLTFFRLPL